MPKKSKSHEEKIREQQWRHGRPPGKITLHWLRAAFDRVAAGEPEQEVMADYGYVRAKGGKNGTTR